MAFIYLRNNNVDDVSTQMVPYIKLGEFYSAGSIWFHFWFLWEFIVHQTFVCTFFHI